MNKKYLGWFLILGFCSMLLMAFLVTSPSKPSTDWNQMDILMKAISIWGLLGGFILWFWMIGAHFKGGKTNHPIIWGFALLFAHIIAAICYFIFVYSNSKSSFNANS